MVLPLRLFYLQNTIECILRASFFLKKIYTLINLFMFITPIEGERP